MSDRPLRVATWNVHGLRGGVEAVAEAVRAERVDVLLLQESGPRRRLRAVGASIGMRVCGDPRAFPRRRVQNAVLVRPELTVRSHRLLRFEDGSFVHPRGALVVELGELTAISVHLGLDGAERGRHAARLAHLARTSPEPVVIGGDLNARPEDAATAVVARNHPDVWTVVGEGAGSTFPAERPSARIDYLFASDAVRPIRAWTAGGTASDHLMVVAELTLSASGEGAGTGPGSGTAGSP